MPKECVAGSKLESRRGKITEVEKLERELREGMEGDQGKGLERVLSVTHLS